MLQWWDLLDPVHSPSLVEYLGPVSSASLELAIVWQAGPWWERGVKEPCSGGGGAAGGAYPFTEGKQHFAQCQVKSICKCMFCL